MININYWAVLAAGVSGVVVGFLWYGPLFGKAWIRLSGFTNEQMEAAKNKGMTMQYLMTFVGSFVMAYVMAHSLVFANAFLMTSGAAAGLMGAFWNWLGFMVPITLSNVLWGGRSWKLWAIDSGYWLATLSFIGIILSVWA